MQRYNEIVRGFQETPPDFSPIYWETNDGVVIAADWAEGFNDAIKLRADAWKVLADDKKYSMLADDRSRGYDLQTLIAIGRDI
jgi:yecA family protein